MSREFIAINPKACAQLHRFHDAVAVYIGDGENGLTVYFSPEQARELGHRLHQYGLDALRTRYLDSQIGTFHMPGVDNA